MAVTVLFQIFHVSLVDDFPSQASGFGADIHNVVGGTDDFFIMLYHYNSIPQLL